MVTSVGTKLIPGDVANAAAVLVTVAKVEGSGPREAGAWMLVGTNFEVVGTIGGGRLEFDALALARAMLANRSSPATHRYSLGPSLGQCCGGVVYLRYELIPEAELAGLHRRLAAPGTPFALFGGGHVGRAIVRACADLPFAVTWIDSRDEICPAQVPDNVHCEHSDPVHGAVRELVPGSLVLAMSFSHAEDLDVIAACLQRRRERDDLPFVGLIGSKTKWATFRHRLAHRGFSEPELAGVQCPIGIPGIGGKEPAVIAASAVAQLLQARTTLT
jgi:xanthine dehydrogenase accessory factor